MAFKPISPSLKDNSPRNSCTQLRSVALDTNQPADGRFHCCQTLVTLGAKHTITPNTANISRGMPNLSPAPIDAREFWGGSRYTKVTSRIIRISLVQKKSP